MNLFCMGTIIFLGILYGILAMVTESTSFRGRNYEGERAVVVGRTIVIIFGLFGLILIILALW